MKRILFILAAGLIAAAIANPLVENISDTGVFGAGYADHDQSSIGPAIVLASFFGLAFVLFRTLEHWIADLARNLSRRPLAAELPFVLGVQFVAEYAMESAERLAHGGSMSGVAWIGGPIAFALAVHIVAGVAMTFGLGRAFCALARTIATTARAVFEALVFERSRRAAGIYAGKRDQVTFVRTPFAPIGPRRGRAPPLAPTLP